MPGQRARHQRRFLQIDAGAQCRRNTGASPISEQTADAGTSSRDTTASRTALGFRPRTNMIHFDARPFAAARKQARRLGIDPHKPWNLIVLVQMLRLKRTRRQR
ncbi:MAG TPA: hypothetical protein VFP74_19215, partial [Pseudolabrys sp.]|nr:hypothetical protein [Pseudolabrys sp.]